MGDQVEYRTLYCDNVITSTESAILVEVDGDETWIPKSNIESPEEVKEDLPDQEIEVVGWFYDKYWI